MRCPGVVHPVSFTTRVPKPVVLYAMATKRRRVTPVPVLADSGPGPASAEQPERVERRDSTQGMESSQAGDLATRPASKQSFAAVPDFIRVHENQLTLLKDQGEQAQQTHRSKQLFLQARALNVVANGGYFALLQSDRRLLVFEDRGHKLTLDTVVPVHPSQLKALRLDEAGNPRLLVSDSSREGLRWLRFRRPTAGAAVGCFVVEASPEAGKRQGESGGVR